MPAPQKRPQGGCDALSRHMRQIARLPLLTPEAEISLARRVQAGRRLLEIQEEMALRSGGHDPSEQAWALEAGMEVARLRHCLRQADKARSQMVVANLRLVISMARRYQRRPGDLEDLIQDGTIGLIKAVERFDPSRGYRFSTYATWWIRESIGSALEARGRAIRLPSTMVDQLYRLRQVQQRLGQQLGRDPGLAELAEATGLKPLDIREVLFRAQEPLSLDAQQAHEADLRLVDLVPCRAEKPHEHLSANLFRQDLERLLGDLDPQQAELLRLRYGLDSEEPMSLCAVARRMGITRDSARGLERRANEALRRHSIGLADYLHS